MGRGTGRRNFVAAGHMKRGTCEEGHMERDTWGWQCMQGNMDHNEWIHNWLCIISINIYIYRERGGHICTYVMAVIDDCKYKWIVTA